MRTDLKKIGPRRATPNFGAAIRGEIVAPVTNGKKQMDSKPCFLSSLMRLLFERRGWTPWLVALCMRRPTPPVDDDFVSSQLHPWIDLGCLPPDKQQVHTRRDATKVNACPEARRTCEQPALLVSGWGQQSQPSPSCPQGGSLCPQEFQILLVVRT